MTTHMLMHTHVSVCVHTSARVYTHMYNLGIASPSTILISNGTALVLSISLQKDLERRWGGQEGK